VAILAGRLEAEERDTDLACNRVFSRFLAEELLPWARQRYRATADPARTVIAGSSFGGLAAACAAIEHPDRFGNVLAQSGSFHLKPEGAVRPEWVARRLAAGPKLPLRFSLDVGLLETWPPAGGGPSLLEANRHLRDALRAKGYDVIYAEYAGGHGHANWQATLPEELVSLLGKR
jgi:enterochelin esterase family protein